MAESSNLSVKSWRRSSVLGTPGTARRFAPYHPSSRRVHRQVSLLNRHSDANELQEINRNYNELINKTWNVFSVTPLFKFQYKALKKYAAVLSARIRAEANKGYAIDNSELASSVSFRLFRGLKRNKDDPEAVEITLMGRSGDKPKVIFQAVLCSVNVPEEFRFYHESFTSFPIMCVKGNKSNTEHLTSWMEEQFDCVVNKLRLNSLELLWTLALWAGHLPGGDNIKEVALKYAFPSTCPSLKDLLLKIDAKSCHDLLNLVKTSDSEELDDEEFSKFTNALGKHFYGIFGINTSMLILECVGTASAYTSSEGKLKIYSKQHIIPILSHYTEIASAMVNMR